MVSRVAKYSGDVLALDTRYNPTIFCQNQELRGDNPISSPMFRLLCLVVPKKVPYLNRWGGPLNRATPTFGSYAKTQNFHIFILNQYSRVGYLHGGF